jgi:hypothetical protein
MTRFEATGPTLILGARLLHRFSSIRDFHLFEHGPLLKVARSADSQINHLLKTTVLQDRLGS